MLDETIARANVLRTEIILAEAVGLPVLTVLGAALTADETVVGRVMRQLRSADLTFRRLTDMQPFKSDDDSLGKLSRRIAASIPPLA